MRPLLTELRDVGFEYQSLLANPDYYNFISSTIISMHLETARTKKFSLSAWVYFHNRKGTPVIRMDNEAYNGPSEFLEKIECPSSDHHKLKENDKFMARVGQITLKHLFDTPMVFEK